ncbi:Protein TAR1 [Capsicum baccatum]|uniref:Protein TAR1 n=1 Tax=Capsicum baccatum TaxID=33114 RepID=A0A2G2UZB3_CAPBA|nr:Protein TAR1 [Capsicum baccatum]
MQPAFDDDDDDLDGAGATGAIIPPPLAPGAKYNGTKRQGKDKATTSQKEQGEPSSMQTLRLTLGIKWDTYEELLRMTTLMMIPTKGKIKVGRWCTPQGDPTNQLPCALRVYSPIDSHICQNPWSVFQDGSNGEPTGQRPERADAEARRRSMLPAIIEETAFYECIESLGCGRPPYPRWSTPRVDRRTGSLPFHIRPGRIAGPHPLSSRQFQALFDSLFKVLFIFPSRYLFAIVSRPYLALDGIHRPIWAAFPNNPTHRQRLVVRQGPGTTGLSPSPAPPSRGLGPGPPLRTLLQTIIRTTEPPDPKAGLFPIRSPLLRESLYVSFPPLIDMLKLSGWSRLTWGRGRSA